MSTGIFGPAYQAFQVISKETLAIAGTSFAPVAIPGGYTQLKLVVQSVPAAAAAWWVRFNGDAGANYTWQYHQAQAAVIEANDFGGQTHIKLGEGKSSVPTQLATDIGNTPGQEHPTSSTGAQGSTVGLYGGRWADTSEIAQIDIECSQIMAIGSQLIILGVRY